MDYGINHYDEIEMRTICTGCWGKKEIVDETNGNAPIPCLDCKGTGKITKWVNVHDFVEYIKNSLDSKA